MWKIIFLETFFATAVGCLLHFTFNWSKNSKIVAIFSAVNESVWEHIKLAISGLYFCSVFDFGFLGSEPNYFLARTISFFIPVLLIPIIFYSYTYFAKQSILLVDILIFIITIFLASFVFGLLLQFSPIAFPIYLLAILNLLLLSCYLTFSFCPPKFKPFEDPITKKYGILAHNGSKHHHHHKKS